ncbi:secreted protein [Melampsora americana]|nr:secreted protein [Melampsora americana]
MMSKSSKSKLTNVFILWVIINVHLYVKGDPVVAVDEMANVAGQAKGVGAATHGENGSNGFQVASSFSHQTSDGRNLGTAATASRPKTGSDDVKIADTMGEGHRHSINALREQNKNLGSDGTSLAGQFDDSKSISLQVTKGVKASEQNPTAEELSIGLLRKKGNTASQSFHAEDGQGVKTLIQNAKQPRSPHQIWEQVMLSYKTMEDDLLKDISKGQQTTSEAPGAPDLPPIFDKGPGKTFYKSFKYLKPAEVQKLSPVDLIRYISERDVGIGLKTENLDKLANNYYSIEVDAFYKAAGQDVTRIKREIQDFLKEKYYPLVSKDKVSKKDPKMSFLNLEMSLQIDFIKQVAVSKLSPEHLKRTYKELQDAKATYDQVFNIIHADARQLISSEALTPEALSKLTNKQYMRKAAFFDQKVAKNYLTWLSFEGEARKTTANIISRFKEIQGDEAFNAKMDDIIKQVEPQATGKTAGPNTIQAAERQFVTEAQALKDTEISSAADQLWMYETIAQDAKGSALRGADRVFKSNKLLGSADLRYKHTGWPFKKFINKILNWFSRLLRKKKQNKEATTSIKPSMSS